MKSALILLLLLNIVVADENEKIEKWLAERNIESNTTITKETLEEFVEMIVATKKEFSFVPKEYQRDVAKILTRDAGETLVFHHAADIIRNKDKQQEVLEFFKKLKDEGKIIIPDSVRKATAEKIEKRKKEEEEKKKAEEKKDEL